MSETNRDCYLTEGCKDCDCWSDKDNFKGYIGCGCCGPIMNCEYFAKKFKENEELRARIYGKES